MNFMYLKYYFFILASVLGIGFLNAQDIIIQGTVDTSLVNLYKSKEVALVLKRTTHHDSQGDTILAPFNKGQFTIKMNVEDSLVYVSFEIQNNNPERFGNRRSINIGFNGRNAFNAILNEVYLFRKGDRISMKVLKNGIILFDGKGSEKLNCQTQIYNTVAPISLNLRKAKFKIGQYEDQLLFEENITESVKDMKLAILKSYRGKLDTKVYNMLLLDIIAGTYYPLMNRVLTILKDQSGPDVEKLFQNHFLTLCKKSEMPNMDSVLVAKSAFYAELLFLQEFGNSRFGINNTAKRNENLFQMIYKNLANKYNGILLDKLLLITLENLGANYLEDAKEHIEEVKGNMSDKEYKKLLTTWEEKQFQTFPFKLVDERGKMYKLNDFSGKVIVIDFWFTGCRACIELNKAMEPIIDRYKANSNITFLTVSVDVDKRRWLKSVSSNLYTSKNSINLFTEGLGVNHPLIKHYGWQGFPQQLIIDKSGNLVSSKPPRVDHSKSELKQSENLLRFIQMIDNAL